MLTLLGTMEIFVLALVVASCVGSPQNRRSLIAPKFEFADNLSHSECGLWRFGDYSWLAKIEADDETHLLNHKRHCFGTVISNKCILTAAFCVSGAEPAKIRVTFAKSNFTAGGLSPVKVDVHPRYELSSLRANLAVLTFNSDLLKNGVLPVCLWNKKIKTDGSLIAENNGVATVVGKEWSLNKTVLGNFRVEDAAACRESAPPSFRDVFENSNICLAYKDGESTCLKGFGAPMQFKVGERWFLRGLYNAGFKANGKGKVTGGAADECRRNRFISFTDVALYTDFVTTRSDVKLAELLPTSIVKPKNYQSFARCGVVNANLGTRLIVSGEDAPLRDYPWSAALFRTTRFPPFSITHACTGSLISTHFVMTAAHCVFESNTRLTENDFVVYLGKERISLGWTPDTGVQSLSVSRVIPHTRYDTVSNRNDIALLRLSSAAEFSQTIVPICIWYKSSNEALVVNKNASLAGWGLIEGYEDADKLQKLDVPILARERCKKIENQQSYYSTKLTSSTLCAGYINEGRSPCNGDSGAALVLKDGGRFYVRGIVSEIVGKNMKCKSDFPAVFTDVAPYRSWILEQTSGDVEFDFIE
ncbi:transmembrane protease serine 13-like [Neocloeon triangulifer]|uniref:transmembrane protease serine 13-like n=1 Tax=Neocloeon triangulifer TaxID=2078957 RepID=UPI00286FA56C|nr:transmembrane protease serine 13-like [Neocloeon triangulifer]